MQVVDYSILTGLFFFNDNFNFIRKTVLDHWIR